MELVRKVAAILNADVVGYSRLMAADELATVSDIVETRQVVARSVDAHQGRIVDTAGDAVLADFNSAASALQCAVDVQRRLGERNAARTADRRMQLRIGINIGDIIQQERELYGDAVNIAARLQALAEPGGVCLSSAVHEMVEGRLPLAFRYAGEQSVKNIARPVKVYHVEFDRPDSPASEALVPAPTPPRAASGPLPQQLSSFVGRAQELAALDSLLERHRLVTLIGPGGVGKTRLSVETAGAAGARLSLDTCFVELAPLADGALVADTIAKALGVRPDPGSTTVDALLRDLSTRPMLLVLDNCEHLLDACASVVSRLLAGCPQLRVLASSREPLHITGEIAFPVHPLAVPASVSLTPAELSRFEAVRLFVERARSRQPTFELDAANSAHVARICRRLDGIALAIELAAARVGALPVDQIARRLDDRFRLLVSPGRDVLPRQQTLHALIDWSHDLLAEPERILLRRLAVFAGGCTLEAAEEVLCGGSVSRDDVLDGLAKLVEKSLVQMDPQSGRYRMLETMREYAWEQLGRAGEVDATREQHLRYFVALAEEARPHLVGAQQKAWLQRLDAEADNLQAAHAASIELPGRAIDGLRMLVDSKMYFIPRARLPLLLDGITASLAKTGTQQDAPLAVRALHTAGQMASRMGRFDEAERFLVEALPVAREQGDATREAGILQELASALVGQGKLDAAKERLEDALRAARSQTDPRTLGGVLNETAQLLRVRGELDAAEPLYEEALQLFLKLEDQVNTSGLLLNLAMVAIGRDRPARARELLAQAHGIATALDAHPIGQCTLAVVAALAGHLGEPSNVPRFVGAAQAEASQSGFRLEAADLAFLEPLWARARDAMGNAVWLEGIAAGEREGYAEAMRIALEWLNRG